MIPENQMWHEAAMLFQMTILKGLSLIHLIRGLNYHNAFERDMNFIGIHDPMSTWAIVRAQFEAYCNFNNIYVNSKSDNERKLLYCLWVISGLKYRQRFTLSGMLQEHVDRQRSEAFTIIGLFRQVLSNPFFAALSSKEQNKIKDGIRRREFQFYFENGIAKQGHWNVLIKNAGCNSGFDHMYSAMSLSTHPSNVSVFQFRDMYLDGSSTEMTFFSLMVSKLIMSFLISDYLNKFPTMKITFNGLPEIHQLLINSFNRVFRGDAFVLNNIEDYV